NSRLEFWLLFLVAATVAFSGDTGGVRLFSQEPPRGDAGAAPERYGWQPIEKKVHGRLQFRGKFSAVDQVELRAQVGGTLTYIGFKDGEVVPKGSLLFTIDPTPYQIKLDEGKAQQASAQARLALATTELVR